MMRQISERIRSLLKTALVVGMSILMVIEPCATRGAIQITNSKNPIEIPEVVSESDLPPALKAIEEYSIPLDDATDQGEAALKTAKDLTPDEFEALEVNHKLGLISRIVLWGHTKSLKRLANGILNRLRIPSDSRIYELRFSPSIVPNAMAVKSKPIMILNAGLLAYVRNVDELAFIMAHEMTHSNPEQMKALEDRPEIGEALNQLQGYRDLAADQREEIRADLGAVERVIRAGYNPWGGYDYFRRFAKFERKTLDKPFIDFAFKLLGKRSFNYLVTHPASELRMANIKAYVVARSHQIDLANNVSKHEKFTVDQNMFRARVGIFTRPLMNVWAHRALYGYAGYTFTDWLLNSIIGVRLTVLESAKEVVGEKLNIGSLVNEVQGKLFSDPAVQQALESLREGGKTALIPLMLGAAAFNLIFMARGLYESDPKFRALVQLRKNWTNALQMARSAIEKEASGQALTFDERLEIIEKIASISESVESIYRDGFTVKWARHFNKLSWIRLHFSQVFAGQLDDLIKDTQNRSLSFSESEYNRLSVVLSRLPGYVFSNSIILNSLAKIYELKYKHPLERGSTYERAENEPRWSHAIRSLRWANEVEVSDPAERIHLAYSLYKSGLKDSAYRYIGFQPNDLLKFVFSGRVADPSLIQELTFLVNEFKHGERSLGRAGWINGVLEEDWINELRIKQDLQSLGDRLRSQSFTNSIPYKGWRWAQLRNYFDLLDIGSANRMMDQEFKSVRDLNTFVDRELVSRNANLDSLPRVFANSLARNPGWLNSVEDIELVMKKEYFWPVLGGTATNYTAIERLFAPSLQKMTSKFPNVWKYEPSAAEKNHAAILSRLRTLNEFPTGIDGKIKLWKALTDRGVTTSTDQLFSEIYAAADESQKLRIEKYALDEGRVWEPELKISIVRRQLAVNPEYKILTSSSPSDERVTHLKKTIEFLERSIPERGRGFIEILEKISVDIMSTREESALIHAAKSGGAGGERQEDLGVRLLSDILSEVLKWSRQSQWDFVRYLREDIDATPKLQSAFKTIGPERVRRMFQLLPVMARTVIIDSFLDAPTGLLGKMNAGRGWSETIVSHIMEGKSEAESEIAREILTGFLHALKATGNKALRSYVLSYLLSVPKNGSKTGGDTLKNVLELFGTTGVKIGQFLAASQLLPERETSILRSLQEQARIPDREDIYRDLESVVGKREFPFELHNLLGAASLKYAMLAKEKSTGEKVVLKTLRLEAIAHTRLEFMILEKMADYLTQKNGKKYSVFGSIVNAAKQAVERELSAKDEVNKGRLARYYLYQRSSDKKMSVDVPREALFNDRMIVAEFAEGKSFFALPPSIQPMVAEKILRMEGEALFSQQPEILFDPDRHAGNYRIKVVPLEKEKIQIAFESIKIRPIDFGQLIRKFTPADRQVVFELFAMAGIGAQVGATDWMAEKISTHFGINQRQKRNLGKQLRIHFPAEKLEPVTGYFAVLSSMELAGIKVDIKYYDFVRAVIQLKQYDPFASRFRDWKTPSELFETEVRSVVEKFRPEVQLSLREKIRYAWSHRDGWLKAFGSNQSLNQETQLLPAPSIETEEDRQNDSAEAFKINQCRGAFGA